MASKVRNVRVPDELWAAAKAKARLEYRSVSDVILSALRAYTGEPPPVDPVWAAPERERLVAEFEDPPAPSLPMTPAQSAVVTSPPRRPRKPAAAAPADPAPDGPLMPGRPPGRYPCCRHCKPYCGGRHADPCTQGCKPAA